MKPRKHQYCNARQDQNIAHLLRIATGQAGTARCSPVWSCRMTPLIVYASTPCRLRHTGCWSKSNTHIMHNNTTSQQQTNASTLHAVCTVATLVVRKVTSSTVNNSCAPATATAINTWPSAAAAPSAVHHAAGWYISCWMKTGERYAFTRPPPHPPRPPPHPPLARAQVPSLLPPSLPWASQPWQHHRHHQRPCTAGQTGASRVVSTA